MAKYAKRIFFTLLAIPAMVWPYLSAALPAVWTGELDNDDWRFWK